MKNDASKLYRLTDVVIRTYDGYSIKAEITGLFHGPKRLVEDKLIEQLRSRMTNDIPVAIDFKPVYL